MYVTVLIGVNSWQYESTTTSGYYSGSAAETPVTDTEKKRQSHIQELFDTEESYMADMSIVLSVSIQESYMADMSIVLSVNIQESYMADVYSDQCKYIGLLHWPICL